VYEDVNGNGLYEVGIDTPLANVDVVITDSAATSYTVATDASGYFSQVVVPGATIVDVDTTDPQMPAGVVLTDNTFGQGSDPSVVTVPDGGVGTDNTGYVGLVNPRRPAR